MGTGLQVDRPQMKSSSESPTVVTVEGYSVS